MEFKNRLSQNNSQNQNQKQNLFHFVQNPGRSDHQPTPPNSPQASSAQSSQNQNQQQQLTEFDLATQLWMNPYGNLESLEQLKRREIREAEFSMSEFFELSQQPVDN